MFLKWQIQCQFDKQVNVTYCTYEPEGPHQKNTQTIFPMVTTFSEMLYSFTSRGVQIKKQYFSGSGTLDPTPPISTS